MQNEITELRNQVRTLKRIVYGFGCLLVAGIVVGATSLQTVPDADLGEEYVAVSAFSNYEGALGDRVVKISDFTWDRRYVFANKKKSNLSV